jgi:lipase
MALTLGPANAHSSDPFGVRAAVPVAGGKLLVARAGPPVGAGEATVLALHGISASHMTYRTVARELAGRMRASLLAPDLRGRGRSAHLPPPFGIRAHVADLLAVLDHAGARRVVLVGHSSGAYLAARLAAEHPERAAALVLLDAGLPSVTPPTDPDSMLEAVVGPAIERLRMRFASTDDYVAGWRAHPAFARGWSADVEAYARYEVVGDGRTVRCVVSEEAVRADARDLLLDEPTLTALDRVQAPVHLLGAPRGLVDDDNPTMPRPLVAIFRSHHPGVRFEEVEDVNHYTLVMGDSPGPARVAAAIQQAAQEARSASAA